MKGAKEGRYIIMREMTDIIMGQGDRGEGAHYNGADKPGSDRDSESGTL